MSNVTHLNRHPRAPRLVWVEEIRDSGWVLRTLPGDGYFGFGEDYDLAVIAAAEMCKHPDTRPDPTSPSAQDIWIAMSHLSPEVTA